MIKDICIIFKEKLVEDKDAGIIDVLEGLTRVLEYYPTEDSKAKRIPFPVDYIEPAGCEEQELTICVPDASKRCIVYFDSSQSNLAKSLDKASSYNAIVSLICWYNTNGFENKENIQTRLISRFSERVKSAKYEVGDFLDLGEIEVTKVIEDASFFTKYTYDQANSQYLTYPYGYFKIDFKVDFLLYENTSCHEPIVVISADNC